jgi:uncharacterized protein YggE
VFFAEREERMRARVVWIAGLASLFIPACAEAQCPAPAEVRATLAVVGNGEVRRAPEIATVEVSLLTRGPTLEGTTRDHRTRVAEAAPLLQRLKGEGVVVEDGAFNLSEERAPVPAGVRPGNDPPTYRAATRYALTMKPLDRVDATVAEIAASGLFEIGSIGFSVADDAAALDDARRAAMADALRQARVYADAGGVRLDAIDGVADGAAAPRGDGFYDLPARMARNASVGITPPKSLAFKGNVTVTWHIVPR